MPTETAPRARTFQHLLLDSGVETLLKLGELTGLWPQQLSYLNGGWVGTPDIRRKVAKELGVTERVLVAAILATGREAVRRQGGPL